MSDLEERNRVNYDKDVAAIELVSKKAQQDLWMKAMDGDQEAWQTLWLQGVRMVEKLVNKFISLGKLLPGDRADAIQEGNLAIGEALPNWSPNRGAYSTYIWTCIRNSLSDYNLQESRGGLTGDGAEHLVQTALEGRRGDDNKNENGGYLITDWLGLGHDLDIDELSLMMDYESHLEPFEREVLDLLLFQDLTQAEAGEHLGWSRQTVAKYAQEGILRMRRAYNNSF